MRVDEACESTFARHETFHPRLGWFRKAFLAAARSQGDFFLADDAPVRLGVGKNMVRSIRFWGTAAHLITDVPNPARPRVPSTAGTNVGMALLAPQGLDPCMEHGATWWWLHWLLLAPGSELPVWWVIFNELNVVEFDEELVTRVVIDAIDASAFDSPHPSSIAKDVTVMLRTYAGGDPGRGKYDDQFGSPLRDLRLATSSAGRHRLATEPSADLPDEIVLAAVLDYLAVTGTTARTTSVARLASEPGTPARAFRLTEEHLADKLAGAARRMRHVTLSAPVGTPQLSWRGEPADVAHKALCQYFDASPERPPTAGREARDPNTDRELELLIAEYGRGVVL